MLVLYAVYLCGFSLYSTKPSVRRDKPENNQINGVKQNHRQNSDTEQEYPENRPANLGTSPNETIEKMMGNAENIQEELPIDCSIEGQLAQVNPAEVSQKTPGKRSPTRFWKPRKRCVRN